MRAEMSRVARVTGELTRTLGRAPSNEQIAQLSGLSLKRLHLVGAVPGEPLSLDMPLGEDASLTLQDSLEDGGGGVAGPVAVCDGPRRIRADRGEGVGEAAASTRRRQAALAPPGLKDHQVGYGAVNIEPGGDHGETEEAHVGENENGGRLSRRCRRRDQPLGGGILIRRRCREKRQNGRARPRR